MHSAFSLFALVATLFAVLAFCGTPVSAEPAPLLAPMSPAKRLYVRKHGDGVSFAGNKTTGVNGTSSASNSTSTSSGKNSTSTSTGKNSNGKNSTSTTSGKNSSQSSSSGKNSSATAANTTSGKTTTTDSSDADMVISTPRLALLSGLLGMGAIAVGF